VQAFNISFQKAIEGNASEFIKMFLPEGYEIFYVEQDIFRTCHIRAVGRETVCAHANYFWSNEPMVSFTISSNSADSQVFLEAMEKRFGSFYIQYL